MLTWHVFGWRKCRFVIVVKYLEDLGLESFVKTTGGKGLHVVVPIQRRHGWDETRSFCKQIAELIQQADPNRYTTNPTKTARRGKVFLRNGRGATAIVPYSTRARQGAPVATPLSWKELGPHLSSDHFTMRNVLERLASLKEDPWQAMASVRQSLTQSMNKLASFFG